MRQNREETLIKAVFEARAQELLRLYEATSELNETTVMGLLREEFISRFLSEFLPKRFVIRTRGIIKSAPGPSSGELDILILDEENLTMFKPLALWLGEHVFPSEAVYMAIEVERKITSDKLARCLDKLVSAKRLSRNACFISSGAVIHVYQLYGRRWRVPPLLTMIFAYDGEDIMIISEALDRYIQEKGLKPLEYPDMIAILKKGVIAWTEDEEIVMTPTENSRISPIRAEPCQVLAFIHIFLTGLLGQLKLPPINVVKYMRDFILGEKCLVGRSKA